MKGIGIRVFYDPDSVRVVVFCISCKVDVPFARDVMNFWRPNVVRVRPSGWRCPYHLLLGGLQISHAAGLPEREVRDGRVHVVINAVFEFDPGIGANRQ